MTISNSTSQQHAPDIIQREFVRHVTSRHGDCRSRVNSDVEIPIYLLFQVGLKRSVELIDCAIYVMMGWWEINLTIS